MRTRKEILARLGARVSAERKRRGITLEKLAYEMGMSKGNLSDIEHGRRDLRYTTLRAIAIGLNMTVAQLVKDQN